MRLLSLMFVLIVSGLSFAQAEQHLSLKDAIRKASLNNLSLRAARKQLGINEGEVLRSGAIPNPEVEAEIAQIPFGKGSAGANDFSLSQTIVTGGKRGLRRKSAVAQLDAAQARYEGLKLDVFASVKEAYWNASFAEDQVKFAKENRRFQQRFLARVQDRFQSGQAKLADVARAKLEVAMVSNSLLVARKDLKVAQAELSRLLGSDVRTISPEPEHLKEDAHEFDEESLIQDAIASRPEAAVIRALERGTEAESRLANRLLWSPDLSAGLLYQTGQRGDGQNSWGIRLGLTLPIWNRYRGERHSAEARKEFMKAQAEDLKQAIILQVHKAFLELRLADEQVKLLKQAVDQATEASRLAEQKYLEGDADLLVFVQTRRDLIGSTMDYLEALWSHQVSVAKLERTVGKSLIKE